MNRLYLTNCPQQSMRELNPMSSCERESERDVWECVYCGLYVCACVDTVQTAAARAMRSRWINGACAALRRFARSWDWSTLNHDPLRDCGSDSNVDVGSDSDSDSEAKRNLMYLLWSLLSQSLLRALSFATGRESVFCYVSTNSTRV